MKKNQFSMDKFLVNLQKAETVPEDEVVDEVMTRSILELCTAGPYISSDMLDGITMEDIELAIETVESFVVGTSSPNHLLNDMVLVQQSGDNLRAVEIKQTNNGLDFF